jgi:nitrite reductase/ring-hydroxylating ferredoxin subunit
MSISTTPAPSKTNFAAKKGHAYNRSTPHFNEMLVQVGPGTPCGELMRRYWQPVGISEEVTPRPQKVRILGEDLILFRDRKGRPGLLYPRCAHRGTNLYYGKVEEEGIRCCYHGWLFSVEGDCLEQPCEPEFGLQRDQAHQPWYPVQEQYGLVYAYMGPPEKMPILPRYDILEDLKPGEHLQASSGGFGGTDPIIPCSYLQVYENIMDPFHVYVLHATFSGTQFVPEFAVLPTCDFEYVESGVIYHAYRTLDNGAHVDRTSSALLPNIAMVPNVELLPGRGAGVTAFVPVDDENFRFFSVRKTTEPAPQGPRKMFNGKSWDELTEHEHQDTPGDYEAQVGQGAITMHSEEVLATSDRGVAMLRRMLLEQMKVVANGGDPVGVTFDPDKAVVVSRSGNFFS